jgi:hypothetical protein
LLLEIAYWRPIDGILGIEDLANAKPSATIRVRQRLLGEAEFGVNEGEDERDGEVGARLQRGFYEKVVRVLGDLRV